MSEGSRAARREEILGACKDLCKREELHNINLKDISALTSCSRPSLYNYFKSAEEMFLMLLVDEHIQWQESLLELSKCKQQLSRGELARSIADMLSDREIMVKIEAFDKRKIEDSCSEEVLRSYEAALMKTSDLLKACISRHLGSALAGRAVLRIDYVFLPYLGELYMLSRPSSVKRAAMTDAGHAVVHGDASELARDMLLMILK